MSARDQGSITLELAVIAPALLLLLGLLVFAGRTATNAAAVDQAARSAAREASLARDASAALNASNAAAARELDRSACASTDVVTDTSGFARPLGQDGTVSVTVTCVVAMADLAVPGLPGYRVVTSSATSPLDRYRAR